MKNMGEIMFLNDREILDNLKTGLKIDPFQADSLSPASYDLAIGDFQSINFGDQHLQDSMIHDGHINVKPGECFLASTIEIIGLPTNILAQVMNKSSTSRKGLFIGSTGIIDPSFIGQLTIVMKNETLRTIKLEYGQKLWQVIFSYCQPAEQAYQGHYQGSEGIVEDRS